MQIQASAIMLVWLMWPTAPLAVETVLVADMEPWLVKTENPVGPGFLIEMNTKLFPGEAIEQKYLPVRRALSEAEAGGLDWLYVGCHHPLPQHESLITYWHSAQGLLVPATSTVRGLSDLKSKTVAVWTARRGNLPALEQDAEINKIEVNSVESGIHMVQTRRVDALLIIKLVAEWHVGRMAIDPALFRYVSVENFSACLFARKALSSERKATVRARMAELVTNGTVEALLQRYRLTNISHEPP